MRLLFLFLYFNLGSLLLTFAQQRVVVPPQDLREADAVFSKRVWRIIDLREKQNKPATWPGNPIQKILYNGGLSMELKPYRNDSLKRYYHLEQFVSLGNDTEYVETPIDPNDPTITKTTRVITPFAPETRIQRLLLLEEWYYSRKYSTQIVRIIAIAPLYRASTGGVSLGLQPLCWFKYYDRFQKEKGCRDLFVNQKIFNPQNQASQLTFDDWFEQRLFSSYIIKSSNQYDFSISDLPEIKKDGIEALIEAERQKQEMLRLDDDRYGE